MSNIGLTYPELLVDLATTIGEALEKRGVAADHAADIAFGAVERVRTLWGGQHLYLPRGARYQGSQRDRQIMSEFNGHNQKSLASKYNLTEMRIYQIIKRQRSEEQPRDSQRKSTLPPKPWES